MDLYVALHYSHICLFLFTLFHLVCNGNIVSVFATLIQTTSQFPVAAVMRGVLTVAVLAGLALFFRPLIVGIARALLLWINPRLTREQKAARRNMRDAKLLQRMIKESHCPGLAAELQALGARS